MDDKAARESREDRPDPTAESDAGAASGGTGSGLAASQKAQNAETVLDPDREPEDVVGELGEQIDRLEGHSRQATSAAHTSLPRRRRPHPPDGG
jgi:hypothetical protein